MISRSGQSATIVKNENEAVWSNDHELRGLDGPLIVLGEPGMGKTELLRYLGRLTDTETVSAVRFMNSKNPSTLVQPNKPLIIDGLD